MKIIDFLIKLNFKRRMRFWKRFIDSKDTIFLPSFRLILQKPEDKVYCKIEDHSIIAARFIFESQGGFIFIGRHSYIGGSDFICRTLIEVGNNVTIAGGCTIYDHDSHSLDYIERRRDIDDEWTDIKAGKPFIDSKNWSSVTTKSIIIKDDAWIGMNSIILKGVTIGKGAIIGAGSVVTKSIPDYAVAAGNPAIVRKYVKNSNPD